MVRGKLHKGFSARREGQASAALFADAPRSLDDTYKAGHIAAIVRGDSRPGGVEKSERFAMDAPDTADHHSEAVAEIATEMPVSAVVPAAGDRISDSEFEHAVRGALEAVGGTLLFKMKVGAADEACHTAAAEVALGHGRQFLVLTLPAQGGSLKVEATSHSDSPVARIVESYAGLMDALKVAA
jgi:hypothetical protein